VPRTEHCPGGDLPPFHDPDVACRARWVGSRGCAGTILPLRDPGRSSSRRPHRLACTINELNLIGLRGYDVGSSSSEIKDNFVRHLAINEAMVRAHRRGVDALQSGPGDFPVGLTLSMDEMVAEPGGEGVLEAAREILEDSFFRATEGDDFIGVQCYSRVHFGPGGQAPNQPGVPTTQMGYEYWPQGVEHCARRAAAITGLPVLLTESGIATEDDAERITYLGEVLRGVRHALDDGVDIRGTSCGASSTISSGHTGLGPSSDSTASIGRHSPAVPSPAHRGSGL